MSKAEDRPNSQTEHEPAAAPNRSWKGRLVCVWGGELVSVLTSSVLQMGFVWHISLTTQSASALSVASLAGFLPMALISMFAGTLIDRLSVKRVLIGADLFIAGVSALVAFASFAGSLPVWVVIVALFFRAIGSSFHNPAFQALTPLVAPPEHLTRLAGIAQGVQSGGYILGTAIAAVIYPMFGLTAMIALDVLGALLATAAVIIARLDATARIAPAATEAPIEEETAEPASNSEGASAASQAASGSPAAPARGLKATIASFLSETAEGYRVLAHFRGILAIMWCGFAFSVIMAPLSALFPLMTFEHFGGTTADAAAVEIAFGIGMLASAGILAATGGLRNRAASISLACVVYGAATLVGGMLPQNMFVAFLAATFIMALSTAFYGGPLTALIQEKVPASHLGRVFGVYGSISAWAMPIGLVASSLFADAVGVAPWFAISGAAMVAVGIVMWAIPAARNVEKETWEG